MQLLREYSNHLRKTGGVHVWYWPNGEPGFRTTNEVPYAGWGMAQWVNALLEGLAGITDKGAVMSRVEVSPRWLGSTNVETALIIFRYAASDGYFAYRLTRESGDKAIALTCTGSGEQAFFSILLPEGWKEASAQCQAKCLDAKCRTIGKSLYIEFRLEVSGVKSVRITRTLH